ncbi:NRDE protein-domain-containing protein [Schizophyllum amplum]|uniref:NRDE protein-domain-containing protein n=1 Tax=Schizophyllum amplum TaxID=97359 RepID=A0A550C6Y1_9AGAR|nr:NRDE protein-domain-containing protein [Auriculariopsis ampla]
MCIAFSALDQLGYALIICTNRDEFLRRPTMASDWHSFDQDPNGSTRPVLSGRDVKAGGTWFGINRVTGHVALLTNITEPPQAFTSSRGSLASAFLLAERAADQVTLGDQVSALFPSEGQYAGFNMLLFAPQAASVSHDLLSFDGALVTNHGAGGHIAARPLSGQERYAMGCSNGVDGEGADAWPKVRQGVSDFQQIMRDFSGTNPMDEEALTERLFTLLQWRSDSPVTERADLRNTIQVIPFVYPSAGSAGPYGTRLSTVLLVRRDGQALFVERDIWTLQDSTKVVKAHPLSQRVHRFTLDREGCQALSDEFASKSLPNL